MILYLLLWQNHNPSLTSFVRTLLNQKKNLPLQQFVVTSILTICLQVSCFFVFTNNSRGLIVNLFKISIFEFFFVITENILWRKVFVSMILWQLLHRLLISFLENQSKKPLCYVEFPFKFFDRNVNERDFLTIINI